MGYCKEGQWIEASLISQSDTGTFIRQSSVFREGIKKNKTARFSAEKNRYHLYVSLACPWAHRTLIFRQLKSLASVISVSVVAPYMGNHGWSFNEGPGVIPDTIERKHYLKELYLIADQNYTGRVTVPVLWDKKEHTIVNNESSEIIRYFNSAFNDITGNTEDYYPEALKTEIDEINDMIYHKINNGVYKVGFTTHQEAYNIEVHALFDALDALENRLEQQPYLCGDRITEADWRLFPTLLRFDCVYYGHFKCNIKHIWDYPMLSNYLKRLYRMPGVRETCNFDHIKQHYYGSHPGLNPSGIVPAGPERSLDEA